MSAYLVNVERHHKLHPRSMRTVRTKGTYRVEEGAALCLDGNINPQQLPAQLVSEIELSPLQGEWTCQQDEWYWSGQKLKAYDRFRRVVHHHRSQGERSS
jgi:hypothetical protein